MRTARVDFGKPLQTWDGFGVNYVEAAQTRDYSAAPQEYGGFSTLTEGQRQEIVELIFGAEGLKPGLIKMFLDSFHQAKPVAGYDYDPNVIDMAAYDHTSTTQWMRYFVTQGLAKTRARGADLAIITTLYGPPGWMTKQRFVRGRDLDPELNCEVAKYLISWAKYCREVEGYPVKYVSLHNEGEDWRRWPLDGSTDDSPKHDYNMYWPPEQVADFIGFMREMLDRQGLPDVGLAPGEPSNWYRFSEYGYADAIVDHPQARKNIGLITSHGFFGRGVGRSYGDWRSTGIDTLRAVRPELHAWVTSTSWSKMDAFFIWEMHNQIYSAKVNAIIPWATVQRSSLWVGGDPNPGTAIRIDDSGNFSVEKGYYFFKQVSRAGQPGMSVVHVRSNEPDVTLIGFAANGTRNPDAFVVCNVGEEAEDVDIEVLGSGQAFTACRTSETERYVGLGTFRLTGNTLAYRAPAMSVTTFYAAEAK
jgi:hypothetical protein